MNTHLQMCRPMSWIGLACLLLTLAEGCGPTQKLGANGHGATRPGSRPEMAPEDVETLYANPRSRRVQAATNENPRVQPRANPTHASRGQAPRRNRSRNQLRNRQQAADTRSTPLAETRPTPSRTESTNEPVGPPRGLMPTATAKKVIAEAKSYLGVRYQWGGMSRSGVDCSGLMVLAFKAADVSIPRVSGEQYLFGQDVPRSKLRPGDMVFFSSTATRGIAHSGLVIDVFPDGTVKFIHSASAGVIISSLAEEYWATHFKCACRVLDREAGMR